MVSVRTKDSNMLLTSSESKSSVITLVYSTQRLQNNMTSGLLRDIQHTNHKWNTRITSSNKKKVALEMVLI